MTQLLEIPITTEEQEPVVPQIAVVAPEDDAVGATEEWQKRKGFSALRYTPYGLAPALVFMGVGFFHGLETQFYIAAGPQIIQDFHQNLLGLAALQQVISFATLAASLVLAYYFDRGSRAPWVGIGNLFTAIFGVGRSLTGSFGLYNVLGIAGQFSSTAAGLPSGSLMADYYPIEAYGRMFALSAGVGGVGALVAPVVIPVLVVAFGWRHTLLVLEFPILLLSGIAFAVLRNPIRGYFQKKSQGLSDAMCRREDPPLSFGETWRTVFAIRTVRRNFVADLVSGIGNGGFVLLTLTLLVNYYHLSPLQRNLLYLPATALGIVGSLVAGRLIDFWSRRSPSTILRLIAAYGLVGAAGSFVLAIAPPLPVVVVSTALVTLGASIIGPGAAVIGFSVIPANVRTLGGVMSNLGSFLTAPVALAVFIPLSTMYGISAAMLLCIPFMVVGAIIKISAADLFEGDRRNAIAVAVAREEWRRIQETDHDRVLGVQHLNVGYGNVQVVFGAEFLLHRGEILALLGTNGAGKSTVLRAVAGLTEATGGSIVFEGRDITHMPPHEIAALGVVMMPGGKGTFPALTVADNLELGAWLMDDPDDAARRIARINELFPILRTRRNEPAGALSGGEQQMLALSQAYLARPRLLLIDELSLGLSPMVVGSLIEMVRQIRDEGTAVIVVEQSVNVALELADRAIFMEKGEVKFTGPTADLLKRPDVLRAVYVQGTATSGGGTSVMTENARVRRQHELDSADTVLEVEDVRKRYGGIVALDGAGLTLRQGEIIGLIGPNGSGKTTLLDVISGFQKPDAGTVRLLGADITALSPDERARRGLIRRFQDARMFPSLTVEETLLIALDRKLEVRNHLISALGLPQARSSERRARRRVDALLDLFQLQGYRDKFVSELSTGLRRIVDMATAIAREPKVLLLDEPSSGIAQAETEGLAPLIRRIRNETGCAILIIEHDMPLISAVSDELIAMERGSVIIRGRADEVLANERVVASYLGGSEAAVKRSGNLG